MYFQKNVNMKSVAKATMVLLVGLASSLVLNAADTGVSSAGKISSDTAVLPKITVSGIMTMGGEPQVLFRAGQSPYSLNVGGQRDGIKVVAIDQQNGTVTFENHGAIQQVDLQKAVL